MIGKIREILNKNMQQEKKGNVSIEEIFSALKNGETAIGTHFVDGYGEVDFLLFYVDEGMLWVFGINAQGQLSLATLGTGNDEMLLSSFITVLQGYQIIKVYINDEQKYEDKLIDAIEESWKLLNGEK